MQNIARFLQVYPNKQINGLAPWNRKLIGYAIAKKSIRLKNPAVHCWIYWFPQLHRIPCDNNAIHTPRPYLFKMYFNIIIFPRPVSPEFSIYFTFLGRTLYRPIHCHLLHTWPHMRPVLTSVMLSPK